MEILVRIVLFGYPLFVCFLFTRMAPHRAVIASLIIGTLFLPEVQLQATSGESPDPNSFVLLILKFTKPNSTNFSTLLMAFLFDSRTILSFRPRWFDVPMAVWCSVPFFSDLGVGDSAYDSFAAMRDQTLLYGVPYFLGRVYFRDAARCRDLAIGLMLGGLVYVPLCLLEARKFPFLHERYYGFFVGSRNEAVRAGLLFAFRPMVFMTHGLMTALWMVLVALVGFWVWQTKAVTEMPRLWRGLPKLTVRWAALILMGTAFCMQSTGAMVLAVVGVVALYQVRWVRWPVLVAVLLLISPLYMSTRVAGMWGPKEFSSFTESIFDKDKASSFIFRMLNEDRMIPRAQESPAFGWGDRGLALKVPIRKGEDGVVVDGFWILTLGTYGFVGLIAVTVAMLLPTVMLLWAYPGRLWSHPTVAPVVACALVPVLFMIDNLSNNFYNGVYVLIVGAVSSAVTARRPLPQPVAPPAVRDDAPAPVTPPTPAAARPVAPRPLPSAPKPAEPPAGRPGVRPRRLPR